MQRRDFSRGLIATGLASPLIIRPAQANNDDEGGPDPLDALGRLILVLNTRQIVVEFFVMLSAGGPLGLDLRGKVPQFNEARASAGKVPLVGGLFRPTLAERFHPNSPAGRIYLVRKMLILVPLISILQAQRVVFAHGSLSWQPKRKPAPMRLSKPLSAQQVQSQGRAVGEAYLNGREMLALLHPSVVDKDF